MTTESDDARMSLVEIGFIPAREHEIESLFAIGNGHVGSRASLACGNASSSPATFVAGAFDLPAGSLVPELAVLPDWSRLAFFVEGVRVQLDDAHLLDLRRVLDVARGALFFDWRVHDDVGRRARKHAGSATKALCMRGNRRTPAMT